MTATTKPFVGENIGSFIVAHAIPNRVRLKSSALFNPIFDHVYFHALIEAIPGVNNVRINSKGGSVVIEYDEDLNTWDRIVPYLVTIPDEVYSDRNNEESSITASDVATKVVLTLLAQPLPNPLKAMISLGVSLPKILSGLETLLTRGLKVEALDALAISLALVKGNYFTAGAISSLLSFGQYLEEHSEQRSTELLKGLLRPLAEQLWVIRDGVEVSLSADDVVEGDKVVFGAGEMIAVDGIVDEGEASVNQSSISGESVPVHIKSGDSVISGSVVEEGRLVVVVEKIGSETSMARIGKFINQSLRNKSKRYRKSAELADKLVPVTLGIGAVAFLLTRDVTRLTSVLTVDFSCAVKLASPITVRSSMFSAGQSGVLLKGAKALDDLQDVDTFVFDKTGTLTTGNLVVTDIVALEGLSELDVLSLAAGAEEHYDHPVARAVVKEAKSRNLKSPLISRVDFIVAHGVSAYIDNANVLVGSYHFIAEDENVCCSHIEDKAHDLRCHGKSLLYVAKEGKLVGLIALRDDPRPEAAEVLSLLKENGVKKIVVLTGDHKDTALALAESLPQIDEVHYELRPEDKAAIVDRLKKEGCYMAYVGDGVNDAPALVNAHVGVCMPRGADLAKEAAQVLLLKEDLWTLVIAKEAAMRTSKIIRTCLATTITCNSVTMLLAVSGLSPVLSAILHNASTVGILGYAAMAGTKPLPHGKQDASL